MTVLHVGGDEGKRKGREQTGSRQCVENIEVYRCDKKSDPK